MFNGNKEKQCVFHKFLFCDYLRFCGVGLTGVALLGYVQLKNKYFYAICGGNYCILFNRNKRRERETMYFSQICIPKVVIYRFSKVLVVKTFLTFKQNSQQLCIVYNLLCNTCGNTACCIELNTKPLHIKSKYKQTIYCYTAYVFFSVNNVCVT